MSYGVVYVVTCLVNQKKYVGQTIAADPQAYWKAHLNSAKYGTRKLLYNAVRKHGAETFTFEVIWHANDKVSLDITEDSFIHLFDTLSPRGYNLRGGGASVKHLEETKLKTSIGVKKAYQNPIVREKHLKAVRRNHANPEFVAKRLTAAAKAQKEPAHRERMRAAMRLSASRPEVKERLARAMEIANARPETKAKRSAGATRAMARPDTKVKHTAAIRLAFTNPAVALKIKERLVGPPWVTNGQVNRKLGRDERLPEGWRYGRFDTSKTGAGRWINDGQINRRLLKEDTIPDGWKFGLIVRRKREPKKEYLP